MTIYSVVLFLSLNVNSVCDTLTVDCGPTYASSFMPSEGRLVTSDNNSIGGRFIFVAFYWNSSDNMTALKADAGAWNFPSLEPDIEYPSNEEAYITNIMEQEVLTIPTILSYRKLPCPYIDTSIDDDSPRPTIGSACPEYFEEKRWYYSLATGTGNASSSKIALRFQLGSWTNIDGVCISTQGFPFFDPVPLYPEAPYCIFSCCNKGTGANENNIYTIQMNEGKTPGCLDWKWPSDVSPSACPENCTNGVDDNWNGLTDCYDETCTNSPNCIGDIDPCSTVTYPTGNYCGNNIQGYTGNQNNLIHCVNGVTESAQYCDFGCVPMPLGTDDYCASECTQICSANETRCNGNSIEICSTNQCSFEYSYSCQDNEYCENGTCIVSPEPLPIITDVTCTSVLRGTDATCTVEGLNFTPGGNTAISCLSGSGIDEGALVTSVTATQITLEGTWPCNCPVGQQIVNHRNGDGHTTTAWITNVEGETIVDSHDPVQVSAGAMNVIFWFTGCNFGTTTAVGIPGVQITNIHHQAEDQVRVTGNVVGAVGETGEKCIAKYAGADENGPDKWCCQSNCILITQ